MRFLHALLLVVLAASSAAAQIPNSDARWDGRFGAPGVLGTVEVVEAVADGASHDVYVGGRFAIAGTSLVHNLARWDADAQTWDGLEGGLQPLYDEYFLIQSLVVLDGGLWVSGYFRASLGTGGTAEHLARFDLATRTWSAPVASLDAGGDAIRMVTDGDALYLATGDGVQKIDPGSGALTTLTSTRATALAAAGDAVYIGGFFSSVEGAEARNVARLDVPGGTWHALGGGVDVAPSALHATGDALYVGGVTEAGGTAVAHLARWDGADWAGVGGGLFSQFGGVEVTGLGTAPDGTLFVTGQFAAAGGAVYDGGPGVFALNAAWFDGALWHGMDVGYRGGGLLSTVSVSPDGAHVYVGGDTVQGAALAVGVARWSVAAGAWAPLLDGPALGVPYGLVQTLTEAPDGTLYGVALDRVGQTELPGEVAQVVRWTGAGWEAVGDLSPWLDVDDTGASDQYGLVLRALAFDGDGTIYAAGQTIHVYVSGGIWRYNHHPIVLQWDGAAWSRLDYPGMFDRSGSQYGATAEVSDLALIGSTLYVGGSFLGTLDASDNRVPETGGVLAYDTEARTWGTVGGGIEVDGNTTSVRALAADPLTGDLFAAGHFERAGGNSVRAIARFDGDRWHGIRGGGLISNAHGADVTATVHDLAITDGALYAVGDLTGAGGDGSFHGIARLALGDETWTALGDGLSMSNGAPATVETVVAQGGAVFVGGTFQRAGGQPARNVAAWDGSAWGPLGSGVRQADDPYGVSGSVSELALHGDALFVGGGFDLAGGRPALGVASYEVGPLAGAETGYLAWANYGVAFATLGFPALEVYVDGAEIPAAVLGFTSFDDLGGGVLTFPANRPFDVRFHFVDETPEAWGVPQDTTITVPAIAPGYYAGNTTGIPRGARHQFAPNPDGFPLEPWIVWSRLKGTDEAAGRRRADVDVVVLHTVTDAPSVDVTVAGSGVVLADDLGYGQGSAAVALAPAVHRVDVRRADTGEIVESVVYDLTQAAGTSVALSVGGFLDPEANMDGPPLFVSARDETGEATGGEVVTAAGGAAPGASRLLGLGPNPTTGRATVRYALAEAADVRADVFDALGRRVAVVAAGRQAAGPQTLTLDAAALGLPSGAYVVRLSAGAWTAAARLTVAR